MARLLQMIREAFKRLGDRLAWRLRALKFGLTAKRIQGASPDPEPDPEPDPPEPEAEPEPEADPEPEPDGSAKPKPKPKLSDQDWQQRARHHERNFKKARDVLGQIAAGSTISEAAREARVTEEQVRAWLPDEVKAKLKEREDAEKTEQQRLIDQAREEARTEAQREFDEQRREDRLEVAVTRHAARGFEIGDGDDKKTVKFADPDDAIVHLERALTRGELDNDELFDAKGKVKDTELKAALAELLERKPHLVATEGAGNGSSAQPQGSADAGRGSGTGTEMQDMTPDDHLKEIQQQRR